jgi:hypothetical protein
MNILLFLCAALSVGIAGDGPQALLRKLAKRSSVPLEDVRTSKPSRWAQRAGRSGPLPNQVPAAYHLRAVERRGHKVRG